MCRAGAQIHVLGESAPQGGGWVRKNFRHTTGKSFVPPNPPFVSRHRWCLDVSFVCASCTHIFNFFAGDAVCDLIQSTQRSALGPSPGQGTSKPHFRKREFVSASCLSTFHMKYIGVKFLSFYLWSNFYYICILSHTRLTHRGK